MIKNIILDMGNVLIEYDVNRPLDALCPNEESKKIIRRELFESEDWLEGDRGNITDAEMLAAAKARVPEKYHAALEKCERHWPDFLNRIDGAPEFCRAMRESGKNIYVLSNASGRFYEYFPRFYDMDFFDGVVVSCDLHIIKPESGIYEYILDKYGLKAEECLFIDDLDMQEISAIAAGFPGRVTVSAAGKPHIAVRIMPQDKMLDLLEKVLMLMNTANKQKDS